MTREVVLYITASVDGFIADAQGGVDWLAGAEGEDYGYGELLAGIDAVLQGSHTYLDTLRLVDGDPYEGITTYVFTSRDDLPVLGSPIFVHEDPVAFVSALKAGDGGRMWLVGGGELASTLISAGLVDVVDLFVQPIILGDGIPLWRPPMRRCDLELLETRRWPADLVQLRYRVVNGS